MTSILIIEDEASHAELIRLAFERETQDVSLTVLSSLDAAHEYLSTTQPDIVFVDLLLPDGRGTDLLIGRQAALPYPVVVMTSYGNQQVAVEALKAGALDYIVKSEMTFIEMPHITERTLREWNHILARRRAEDELRQTAAELSAFIESAAHGVLVTDEAGIITLVNQRLEQIFGYTRDELIGQYVEILLPDNLHKIHIQHRQSYLNDSNATGMQNRQNLVGRRKDESEFPAEIAVSSAKVGDRLSLVALILDITERKQLEATAFEAKRMQIELAKEKELRQYKDRFLSMLSHEFRTPLAVIRISNDILKHLDRLTPQKIAEHRARIEAQVLQLANMLEEILLLIKSEMRRIEYTPRQTNLVDFCQHLIDTVCSSHDTHQVKFSCQVQDQYICIDSYLMEHILVNLMGNAIKYSPNQHEIEFDVHNEDDTVAFQVSDHGIGISAEDQIHLFEPFHRGNNVDRISGTGLGLAIVREFIELHHGRISVHSELGIGTQFTVFIPRVSTCT